MHSVAPKQFKPEAVTFLYISVIGFVLKASGQSCQHSAGLPTPINVVVIENINL